MENLQCCVVTRQFTFRIQRKGNIDGVAVARLNLIAVNIIKGDIKGYEIFGILHAVNHIHKLIRLINRNDFNSCTARKGTFGSIHINSNIILGLLSDDFRRSC